ncbi:MAG: hypothetical protein SOY30_12135 [Eubacteriales bacterium]|nr:hypothetical protein [Eubacteriales bacterium]
MRNLRRLVAMLLVLTLAMSMAGIAAAEDEPIKLKVAAAFGTPTDWTQNDMVHWIRDNFNLDLECDTYPLDAWMNQLSLMLLTDELPDIIYNNTLATYTAINQYGDEGYFLNFLDYLDVMPNFKKHLETYPEYAAYITSPSGAIYSMSRVNPTGIVMDDSKAQINIEWLKNVGKEIPTTLDELYDVLCAFRDQDANGNGDPGDEIPMSYCNASAGSYRLEWNIRAAFGIYSDQRSYCLQADENNQVYIAETTEGYKDFLKYMRKLYAEGLLDSETYIQTNDEFRAKLTENIVGYGNDSSTMSLRAKLGEDVWDYCLAFDSEQTGQKAYILGTYWLNNPRLCVSATTEYPEEICKLLDYFLSPEGSEFSVMGLEGVNYDRVMTDLGIMTYDYTPYMTAAGYEDSTTYLKEKAIIDSFFYLLTYDYVQEYLNTLTDAELEDFIARDTQNLFRSTATRVKALRGCDLVKAFPSLSYTQEQTDARADIYTDITNYIATMKVQFITGVVDIDSYWDTFVSTLNEQGLETILAIDQEAYNHYLGL